MTEGLCAGERNNMKNQAILAVFRSFVLFATLATVFSCNPAIVAPNSNMQQLTISEGVTSILTEEIDDMVMVALNNSATSTTANNGRMESITDDRLTCANIVFSDVDPVDKAFGKMTITFPSTGCVDGLKGNVRKGSITVTWTGGRWYRTGSTHTITLNNYSANDIAITGTRTLAVTSYAFTSATFYEVTWAVSANHKLTWPDGSSAIISATFTKDWQHSSNQDQYTYSNPDPSVGAYAYQGTNRHGKKFTVSITTPLVVLYGCVLISKNYMPVYGVKTLTNTTDNVSMTVNYGNYTCDNAFTLTISTGSVSLRAKNNSSDD